MSRLETLSLAAILLVFGSACAEDARARDLGSAGQAGGGSLSAGAGGTAGTGTGGSGIGGTTNVVTTATADDIKTRCPQSKIAPPTLRRLTRDEIESSILDIFPQIATVYGGVKLGPDPLSNLKFTNDASVLVVGADTARDVLKTAKDVAALVTNQANLPGILPCSTGAADAACATTFINTYGPRILRHPLTDEERTELAGYHTSVADRSNFVMGLKWTLITMLQSPDFLYRTEIGNDTGQLTPDEIAAELSYTFGGTTPSAALMAKAESGALASADALVREALALQQTPLGRGTLQKFFREWTGYEKVLGTTRDVAPNFDVVGQSMVKETQQFLDEVVFNTGGNVQDLLTAKYTFVDATLAPFYGFGTAATGFAKATRPANRGIGLLAQGSILAGTSHPTQTSPVFRGLLVYANVLCNTRPKPPPIVPKIEDSPPANTTRERFENAHAQSSCKSCHQAFEPFGYAFEFFDETGRYRANEKGFAIDAAASIQLSDGTTISFNGLDDLVTQLAAMQSVTDCVSGLLANYAFAGAGGRVCLAEDARSALAKGTYGLRDYYAQLASAPSFTRRVR